MTPILLSKNIPWFGGHTGYQQLPRYLRALAPDTQVVVPRHFFSDRFVGKAYSLCRGWSKRNQWDAAAEYRFERANGVPHPVRHILHLEEHVWFLDKWEKAPQSLFGTLHLPPGAWTDEELTYVSRLSSGIILYRRDRSFFESLVGAGRVHFIPHGVDVEFFRPMPEPPKALDIVCTGHYLRNTRMLARVVPRLLDKYPEMSMHMIVPEEFRNLPGLPKLRELSRVFWHQRLSDEELRERIASSFLLLLPMNNSGANTAVVESLACGTPIATTDVGGIRDYGGGSIYPVVSNDDDDALIRVVEQYIQNPEWRNEVAGRCRKFAETELAWPLIAKRHLETYETLAN